MSAFDYIQVGNGPISLTCRDCGYQTTVQRATSVQPTVNQHKCRQTTKSSRR
ncbi:hypothetical protein AB0L71_28125 [Streptomyces sp. NPDC052052]|uniref:hypothetical protein n=1 Tax=Streptomyces sp. NPDC052052 TaxID=3154756 RepID=UPI0034249450